MKSIVIGAALLVLSSESAAELSRQDFAFGAQLQTDAQAAAYEFTLPIEALRQSAFADLRDIRVFNADDQLVPFSLRRMPVTASAMHSTVVLPIFPLRGDANRALQALRVNIAAQGGDISVNVPTSKQGAAKAPLLAFLVDARQQTQSLVAIDLLLKDDAKSFSTAVTLDASDDLTNWRVIRSGAPFVNIEYNGQQLRERRIEFPPLKSKFLRLSTSNRDVLANIQSLTAEAVAGEVEPARESLTIDGTLSTSSDGLPEYRFDVGVHAPIDRVNLLLPDVNSVIAAQVFSRPATTSNSTEIPWRWVGRQTFYRLQSESREIRNRSLSFVADKDRYWAIRLESKTNAIGTMVPQLQVEWLPQRVMFLARGKAPYWLAFGSVKAASAEVALPVATSPTTDVGGELIHPASARSLNVVKVGDASLLEVPHRTDWKTITLWTSLIIGVAFLAWMALRLLRELNAK